MSRAASLPSVHAAFALPPETPASTLACGLPAHVLYTADVDAAPAFEHGRHDDIRRVRHAGWHADGAGHEILTGYVYAYAEPPDYDAGAYYAVARCRDADLHYVSPTAFDDPADAAREADGMAESIAELERDADDLRSHAARARTLLEDGRGHVANALAIFHAHGAARRIAPPDPDFRHLWTLGRRLRSEAWRIVDLHRPAAPPFPGRPAVASARHQTLHDAWRDGWEPH